MAQILASLALLDPGGRYSNRPSSSLRNLFLLWSPQTTTSLDGRLRVLRRLRAQNPEAAWPLMLSLIPRGHDMVMPSSRPRWRDLPAEDTEEILHDLIVRGATTVIDWLREDVGASAPRWLDVIRLLPVIGADRRAAFLQELDFVAEGLNEAGDRAAICKALRHLLHQHRTLPEARWALPEDELAPIDVLYHRIEPRDAAESSRWLFEKFDPDFPRPTTPDTDAWDAAHQARRGAVERIFAEDCGEGSTGGDPPAGRQGTQDGFRAPIRRAPERVHSSSPSADPGREVP